MKIEALSYTSRIFSHSSQSRFVLRRHRYQPPLQEVDVQANYWMFSQFRFPPQKTHYKQDHILHELGGIYGMIVPPFSITEWHINNTHLQWGYFIFKTPYPVEWPSFPFYFQMDKKISWSQLYPLSLNQLTESIINLIKMQNVKSIASCTELPESLLRFKSLIDNNFRQAFDLKIIADEMGKSYESLGRSFKMHFGLTPVSYRNRLRMMQTSVDLIFEGKTIDESFRGVGLEDSSSFYEKFRTHLLARPSQFRDSKIIMENKHSEN